MVPPVKPGKELVNVRYSARVRNVPANEVQGLMSKIKELLSEWGEVDVVANLTYPRQTPTLEELRRVRP